MQSRAVPLTLALGLVALGSAFAHAARENAPDFDRDIRPIFSKHCLQCHGPKKQKGGLRLDSKEHAFRGGEDGEVLRPGDSAHSRLLEFVGGLNPDKVMPPKGERLLPQEVALLRLWIDQGAVWPESGAADRKVLWSLQPNRFLFAAAKAPEKTAHVPQEPNQPESMVDSLLLEKLREKGLSFSPTAEPRTLLRRLCFDLTGLPPSVEDFAAFEEACGSRGVDGAYAEAVERLLASPHYGERWGRHWLDVVRFAESNGFEQDRMRDNAWHYRDYVIASFNADKPYDQFMREQIAGDIFEHGSRDAALGTGMLVCGPWDSASNIQSNPTLKAIAREDELEDIIGVVGQTFLGLTLNCARCHSHKFDPVSHTEYHRIKSVFEGVRHGERELPDGSKSYVGVFAQPQPTYVLARGNVNARKQMVSAGALAAVAGLESEFGLSAEAPERERRAKFAAWLADTRNPLPARVMVNRVWQYHFGQGLVKTANDFGFAGSEPSHPELLDRLAAQFVRDGWSVKALHRRIVHSAAYRQSSAFRAEAAARDEENRLVWRYAPRRLEAEAVRDAMLAASGTLNRAVGGPSFRPFRVTNFNAFFYHTEDRPGPECDRRSVYRANVISGKDPLLDVFDCPDPAVKTPARSVTTTPLQALELMNNEFVLRMADALAERVRSAASPEDSIRNAYRLTLGRLPSARETERALAAAQQRSLSSVCWALLNSTEFLTLQ